MEYEAENGVALVGARSQHRYTPRLSQVASRRLYKLVYRSEQSLFAAAKMFPNLRR